MSMPGSISFRKERTVLDIQQVLLTNAAFTLGSMVFESPRESVADTVGRRCPLLLASSRCL